MSKLTLEKKYLLVGKLYKEIDIEAKRELGKVFSGDIRTERKNLIKLVGDRNGQKRIH